MVGNLVRAFIALTVLLDLVLAAVHDMFEAGDLKTFTIAALFVLLRLCILRDLGGM